MTSYHLCHILLGVIISTLLSGRGIREESEYQEGRNTGSHLKSLPTTTQIHQEEKKPFHRFSGICGVCRVVEFGASGCLGWKISIKQNSESAGGLEAVFCQIQYHLEYWSKVIQNLKPAETGGNQNSFAAITWQKLCVLSTLNSLLQTPYYYP